MTRRPIAVSLLILAAWGCQSTPAPEAPAEAPAEVPAVPETPADLLSAAAEASGARSDRLYLEAAEQFLNDNDLAGAAEALAAIEPRRLRDREAARYWLASAAVALANDDLAAADAALDSVDERHLLEPLEVVLLRADLRTRQGEPATATAYLISFSNRHPELRGNPSGQRLNDAIWRHLMEMPTLDFLGRPPSATVRSGADASDRADDEVLTGWWYLKSTMLQSFTLADQQRRLATWQQQWPQHPAAGQPPAGLEKLAARPAKVIRVGLLLPLSGPLARAGRAVRDGFVATYLAHRADAGFDVTIYDVAAEPLPEVYERALSDGANILIGPLARETVVELNRLNPEVPVLLLNYLGDEQPAPNVLQLGLAIEDEAATLARWLADQASRRLLIFHNDEEWSVRAMQAMASNWNGAVSAQALGDIRTVTESVGAAMQVSASQQRLTDLQELLRRNLEFTPRARGDVDAIVALVSPVEVGALLPALRFHSAHTVPIYATSQTLRGVPQQRLRTLNGFHITELPWFVVDTESYPAISEAFTLDGNIFASLYALGVDAFRLAERVPLIVDGNLRELIGSTGILRFNGDGRIERSLARTVVRNGRLEYATRRGAP